MNIAMAQSLSFFGNRRGSTKSHTYQVNSGQQITKDRVDTVKNPRSEAQMVHRCCLHTLSDAHAYLRPVIGRFWEGAQSPAASLAAFRKANYPIIRAAAESGDPLFSFSPYKQTTYPIGLYQVSDGILSSDHMGVFFYQGSSSAVRYRGYYNGSSKDYLDDLISEWGLSVGDVVFSIIIIPYAGGGRPAIIVVRAKVLAAPHVRISSNVFNENIKIDISKFNYDGTISRGYSRYLQLIINAGSRQFSGSNVVQCNILQRKVNGKIHYSKEIIEDGSISDLSPTFAEAIATYPQGGGNVLDGGAI